MARGGYYAGSDYVPYKSGALSQSSANSLDERKKPNTIKCPYCGRVVPLKRVCVFCEKTLIR